MPKPEWGVKRVCPTTGKRFYDMNLDPIVSPYTGEVVQIDTGAGKAATVGARAASGSGKAAAAKPQAEDPLIEEDAAPDVEADLLEDDDDDSVSLDELADVAEKDDET